VSALGVKTQIGTALTGAEDIADGPCGALYVSRRVANEVLRISRPASPDINNTGIVDAADLALLLGAWGEVRLGGAYHYDAAQAIDPQTIHDRFSPSRRRRDDCDRGCVQHLVAAE